MTFDEIEKITLGKYPAEQIFEIRFKVRNSILGLFIKTKDYKDLCQKNLWRIVSESRIDAYLQSHDETLARIFNGSEITGLAAKK